MKCGAGCPASDAWRCAVARKMMDNSYNLLDGVTCRCGCHRYMREDPRPPDEAIYVMLPNSGVGGWVYKGAPCLKCKKPVAKGEGAPAMPPFPALHSKCMMELAKLIADAGVIPLDDGPPIKLAGSFPKGERGWCKGCGLMLIIETQKDRLRTHHQAPLCDAYKKALAELGESDETILSLVEIPDSNAPAPVCTCDKYPDPHCPIHRAPR